MESHLPHIYPATVYDSKTTCPVFTKTTKTVLPTLVSAETRALLSVSAVHKLFFFYASLDSPNSMEAVQIWLEILGHHYGRTMRTSKLTLANRSSLYATYSLARTNGLWRGVDIISI